MPRICAGYTGGIISGLGTVGFMGLRPPGLAWSVLFALPMTLFMVRAPCFGLPAALSFTDPCPASQARARLYNSADADHSMHELLCSNCTTCYCMLQQIGSASIASLLRSLCLCSLPGSPTRSRLCTSTLRSSGKITPSAPGVFSRLFCKSYGGCESHAGSQSKGGATTGLVFNFPAEMLVPGALHAWPE